MPKKDQTQTPTKTIDRFLQRHLKGGESITALADEYGVSRATGYIWLRRHREATINQSLKAGMSRAAVEKADKMTIRAENAHLKRENAKLRTMVVNLLLKARSGT
jgi:transposase-like protein